MKTKAGMHRAAVDELRAAELDRETRIAAQSERDEPIALSAESSSSEYALPEAKPLTFTLSFAGVL